MTSSKTSIAKRLLAMVLAAMVALSLMPTFAPPQAAYAADGDGSSITFKYEANGEVAKTKTISYADLDTEITQDDGSDYKYLAWTGSEFKVYGTDAQADGILLTNIVTYLAGEWSVADSALNGGTVVVKLADGTVKEYSSNDTLSASNNRKSRFITNASATEIPSSPSFADDFALLTTSAKVGTISTTSEAVTPSDVVSGLSLLTNLDPRGGQVSSYGDFETLADRYKALGDLPKNIVEITFANSTTFNVYEQVGDAARTVKKSYNDSAFAALATTGKAGFLQYVDDKWTVHGTDKYVKIQDLINDSGLVFNAGDALLVRSSDMFSYRPTYETIQTEKYFFGGISDSSVTTTNPTDVGAVIAVYDSADTNIVHFGSSALNGTAASTLADLTFSASGQTRNKRFFIGLSADNAIAKIAAGNRFPQYVTEITVIKDKADVITDTAVTGIDAIYKETGNAIEPEVKVTIDGVTLVKDRDYSVTYGPNKEVAGAVVVIGKGNVTGTVVKTFEIGSESKKTVQAKLDAANQALFKATTPAKGSFKAKAGKKKATVQWKKISKATNGYQIQYGTNKKITKGKKTVKVASTSTVKKTISKLKKGKTYYFKVRGVAKIGDKTVYTKWSAVKSAKIK